MKRIVVLVSGSGSNLQALIDAERRGEIPGQVVLVVSNRRDAYGLVRAQNAGIKTLYFPLSAYKERGGRPAYDTALADRVRESRPDLIVLAGWMHILSAAFLNCFPGQVINLHPALPGTFPGVQAIERTFEAFQRGEVQHGGVMIHYAIPEVDAGAVIAQESVPILADDTLHTFETRLHRVEHRLLAQAVAQVLRKDDVE